MMTIPSTGWDSSTPLEPSAVAAKKAAKAPNMKTSPWAKLIRKRIP